MNKIDSLIADNIVYPRGRQDSVIYDDLKQVQIRIDDSNLFQAIVKPISIVNITRVEKGLGDLELHHDVDLGLDHLIMKNGQLHH